MSTFTDGAGVVTSLTSFPFPDLTSGKAMVFPAKQESATKCLFSPLIKPHCIPRSLMYVLMSLILTDVATHLVCDSAHT